MTQERAEKAEAAARDFAALLRRLDEWDVMSLPAPSDGAYWRECIARTFARHPEYAPDRKETNGEAAR